MCKTFFFLFSQWLILENEVKIEIIIRGQDGVYQKL